MTPIWMLPRHGRKTAARTPAPCGGLEYSASTRARTLVLPLAPQGPLNHYPPNLPAERRQYSLRTNRRLACCCRQPLDAGTGPALALEGSR